MMEAAFIIGIALGTLLGLVIGIAATMLVMVSVDESDKAAAYYYGILIGERNAERNTSQIQDDGEGATE